MRRLDISFFYAAGRTTSKRTESPARAARLISASRLNLLMRPRTRSFILGCVRPRRLAAAACVIFHDATVSRIAIIISLRAFILAACAGEDSIASHTLRKRCLFIGVYSALVPGIAILQERCRAPMFAVFSFGRRGEHIQLRRKQRHTRREMRRMRLARVFL